MPTVNKNDYNTRIGDDVNPYASVMESLKVQPPKRKPPTAVEIHDLQSLISMLKHLKRKWNSENRCMGLGELWKLGLTDDQFERLCGLANTSMKEVEQFQTVTQMPLHAATLKLGIDPDADEHTDRSTLQKRFVNRFWDAKRNQIKLIRARRSERSIDIPTVYFVHKSADQIAKLKALKKLISGLEMNEEPV